MRYFYVEVRQELHLENLRGKRVLIDGPRACSWISLMISLAMRYRRALLAAEDDGSRVAAAPEERLSQL
jgi:hypothetical protein